MVMAMCLFTMTVMCIVLVAPHVRMHGSSFSITPAAATTLANEVALPRPLASRIEFDATEAQKLTVAVLSKELAQLRKELQETKKELELARKKQTAVNQKPLGLDKESVHDPSRVCINMPEFLGDTAYFAGAGYDPYMCFPELKTVYKDASQADIDAAVARLTQDLCRELARIRGLTPEEVDPEADFWQQPVGPSKAGVVPHYPEDHYSALRLLHTDKTFLEYREAQARVLARYTVNAIGQLIEPCDSDPDAEPPRQELASLGSNSSCFHKRSDKQLIDKYGYSLRPWVSPRELARESLTMQHCTLPVRSHRASYADWLKAERMRMPEWKTFNTDNYEYDTLLLLFDIMYERETVFTRQYWQGVITMQNPFDMYSIQDIIFTLQPDLIIETGTANGGSALLWASILELSEVAGGRVLTVDVNEPAWQPGNTWGGVARNNPVEHKLWKKRVTFAKGGSTDTQVLQQIKAAASTAKTVLVLLDSGHHAHHVAQEMAAYCPLVSVGSYCIVEDVKLSRWAATGPLEAIQAFLEQNPNWVSDRSRELLFTHHASGYLRRNS